MRFSEQKEDEVCVLGSGRFARRGEISSLSDSCCCCCLHFLKIVKCNMQTFKWLAEILPFCYSERSFLLMLSEDNSWEALLRGEGNRS